ncbi:hypothetical protein KJ359_012169 [Pestalotiopsis sp. 9143b]|nr:hypothetical protein KJ359_012169 [Pestalotiopsis sp. 9143b]
MSAASVTPIPEKCKVLVIGGGPGGSYAATVLARENIDTVIFEAEHHPRYHIGESTLVSFRHYLKFIDLEEEFDKHGFTVKVGAAFKMVPNGREGFTDFRAGGPDNIAWNLIRSEGDEKMFRHAARSGAKTFEGTKVTSIEFEPSSETNGVNGDAHPNVGRPVAAEWKRDDGTTGKIAFDYVVDASGRAGILSTKYLKNRAYSKALKNVANWAYFTGGNKYKAGTDRGNSPLFEALHDESGWVWYIPLHNGTHSVGVVRNQTVAAEKKRAADDIQQYFTESLKLAPMISELLGTETKQVTDIHSASDFSYHAKTYAIPHARIVGDAGCFIDPFFSSGIHLALTAALSAATTIAASIRGDVNEAIGTKWHTDKIREAYARFLLVVLGTYQQMRNQEAPVLSDVGEDNFDRAFKFFQPVIQGTSDSTGKFTQADLTKTVSFLTTALTPVMRPDGPDEMQKAQNGQTQLVGAEDEEALKALIMSHQSDTAHGLDRFTTDVIDGRVPKLERGSLTLVAVQNGA